MAEIELGQKALEDKAWDCSKWPDWLCAIVDKTAEVADRLDMSAEQAHAYAALAAALAHTGKVGADVAALVVAARKVAFEDQSPEAIKALDKASEAFADRVPWDDEPEAG